MELTISSAEISIVSRWGKGCSWLLSSKIKGLDMICASVEGRWQEQMGLYLADAFGAIVSNPGTVWSTAPSPALFDVSRPSGRGSDAALITFCKTTAAPCQTACQAAGGKPWPTFPIAEQRAKRGTLQSSIGRRSTRDRQCLKAGSGATGAYLQPLFSFYRRP